MAGWEGLALLGNRVDGNEKRFSTMSNMQKTRSANAYVRECFDSVWKSGTKHPE
jgi:hypothetical protein